MLPFLDVFDCNDIVQNKYNGRVGKILSISFQGNQVYLDVLTAEKSYWNTPASNWEVVSKEAI